MTTPTNQEDIDSLVLRALMTAPNSMMEKTINDKPLTVFEVQNYKILTQAINTIIDKKCNEARIDELEKLTDEQMNSQDWERANPGYSVEMVEATKIYDRLAELTKGGNNE